MNHPRSSGLLLHVSSLPGPHGIGDLGREAYRFVDFLAAAGQRYWQVLPLVPTGHGNSPYSSPSTFASNPLFISFDTLVGDGLLEETDFDDLLDINSGDEVDYERVIPARMAVLRKAYINFKQGRGRIDPEEYSGFIVSNHDWLHDYARFMALREHFEDAAWTEWPPEFARRDVAALEAFDERHAGEIERHVFWQYLFARQWSQLKAYCHKRSVEIFGDLPIYVAHDSADVWAHPELFYLDDRGMPTIVAGVPPDYFSETGQRWGNPLYRWDLMERDGFRWWRRRLSKILDRVDLVRLDHFRAFAAYWEIPAAEETAIEGRWVDGPSDAFFHAMEEEFGSLPVVAEDLGIITPEVTALMNRFGYPGMAVYQFGFDSGPESTFLPHHFSQNLVAYTGTHDNDTLAGWWQYAPPTQSADARASVRAFVRTYLNLTDDAEFPRECVRTLMASVAHTAIFPVQDLLGLGSEARMNTPGLAEGNWRWRLPAGHLTPELAARLHSMTATYCRLPSQAK
jgi:4-alpha-glucanotransferase